MAGIGGVLASEGFICFRLGGRGPSQLFEGVSRCGGWAIGGYQHARTWGEGRAAPTLSADSGRSAGDLDGYSVTRPWEPCALQGHWGK
eukprot:3062750-Pyramimonas_sp.AAC.1